MRVSIFDITPEYDIHLLACLDTEVNGELIAMHSDRGHTIAAEGSEQYQHLHQALDYAIQASKASDSAHTWALLGSIA